MSRKWNLQDIQPSGGGKRRHMRSAQPRETVAQTHTMATPEETEPVNVTIERSEKKRSYGLIIALALIVFVIGGAFAASILTAGAEVTVYPRFSEPNINAEFTAYKEASGDTLSYEILLLEAESELQVQASGKESVQTLTEGTITVFKSTPGSERLVKNTRFATPDGLVFRAKETVVVPGAAENNAGDMVPGQIQAEVFADEPGDQYNIVANTELRLPGLEEGGFDDLYESIYAVNPSQFTGGFDGERFIIADDTLREQQQALQLELRDTLLDQVDDAVPNGFIAYDNAITFTYNTLPAVAYGEDLATIKEQAVLRLPMFQAEDLAMFLADAAIPGYDQGSVRIEEPSALTFSYTNATTAASNISNVDSLEFKLSGRPLIVWEFDESRLAAELLNTQKTALPSILGGYPAIERAEAVIRPFWKRTFPDELNDIEIIEVLEHTSTDE